MSNVKLAIRVRPFTEKEIKSEKDRVQVVNVINERTVAITNIKVSLSGAGDSRERVRRYFADYTFNSACASLHPDYASQQKIFDKVGRQALSTIISGQSACILTYGQSATGKTHTMMGSAEQPGLIPRLCRALADQRSLNITVSYLEIYNEKVHDLLATEVLPLNSLPRRKGNIRKDLRVREHPTNGPYVQNLRRVPVHDIEALLSVVTEGSRRRRTAATKRNSSSSRSHALLELATASATLHLADLADTISLLDILLSVVTEGSRRRRTAATKRNSSSSRSHALLELATASATLHLADLAGSEKSGWEGCGGRQKEGSNINKSLVALSNVISALVNGGAGRGRFVPYRDSALTWLLKDCFTGGGKTYIIATISPSAACYGESASTLRWTSNARLIPAQFDITTSTVSKATLQLQFKQLINQLANNFIQYKPELGILQYDDKHWDLQINKIQKTQSTNSEATIGNIMSLGYPKTEARNPESTPSSITSGSSDIINNMDKNIEISNEINKEIDELFGPALERTKSGSDIEVIAPLRHKKRQFRSQEVLQDEKIMQRNKEHRLSDAGLSDSLADDIKNNDECRSHVPILYDNQRAEIIASVTERLYSKLKKNDAAIAKAESLADKKQLSEPKPQSLSELKICSNARLRLMELSKKALRNKRKIGIPTHTQTRKSVIRVKDQSIDIQTDLLPYLGNKKHTNVFQQDVSTETTPLTPRLKEIGVGSKYGTLCCRDRSTATENKKVIFKNTCVMTDIISSSDRCTQTYIQPPPRRKRRLSAFSKYIKKLESIKPTMDERYASPVININISPIFQAESESQTSDESETSSKENKEKETHSVPTTPDLLTNHNSFVNKDEIKNNNKNETTCKVDNSNTTFNISSESINFDDSSEVDDLILPRVTVDPSRKIGKKDYEDLIFGMNDDVYPYNIKLSPTKERDASRRVIRFKDIDVTPAECCSDEWQRKVNTAADVEEYDVTDNIASDYSESNISKGESDPLVWHKCPYDTPTDSYPKEKHESLTGYKNRKTKLYEEFADFTIGHCLCATSSYKDENDDRSYKNIRKSTLKKASSTIDVFEKKIKSACNSLESSVNKYDDYFMNFREKRKQKYKEHVQTRTPKEYLQHLIRLRREAVSSDSF